MPSTRFFQYPGEMTHMEDRFLAGLHDDEIERLLRYMEIRRYETGAAAVTQGDMTRDLFIVTSGRFAVSVHMHTHSMAMETHGPGEIFGSTSFFDGQARAATIRATEPSEALVLTPLGFRRLRLSEARLAMLLVLDLGRMLARHLRDHDRQLMSLRELHEGQGTHHS